MHLKESGIKKPEDYLVFSSGIILQEKPLNSLTQKTQNLSKIGM
jgi:hypothetical protein